MLKLLIFAFSIAAFLPSKDIQTFLVHDDGEHSQHLERVASLFEGSLEQFFILSYSMNTTQESGSSITTLTAHTFFGLPYLEIIVHGDDAYVNRRLLLKREN